MLAKTSVEFADMYAKKRCGHLGNLYGIRWWDFSKSRKLVRAGGCGVGGGGLVKKSQLRLGVPRPSSRAVAQNGFFGAYFGSSAWSRYLPF